jgi:hypothetical protein
MSWRYPGICLPQALLPARQLESFQIVQSLSALWLAWEEIRERIRQAHADVIGISALFTPFYREALHVAALAKADQRAR